MAVADHVCLEARLVRKLDSADAAEQPLPARQRHDVLLKVDVFIRHGGFRFRQTAATRSARPAAGLPFPVEIDGVQLIVRREILDLVENLRLDLHLDKFASV